MRVPLTTSTAPTAVLPRSVVAIGLDERLRGRLAELAHGRTLAIGMFTARCCGSPYLIGDLTAGFVDAPDEGAVALTPIEGVPLVADERLVELLADAGPTIVLAGLPFVRHLAVELEVPEAWLDFLASPRACRPQQN
jgi:hypothetical protein